MKGIHFKGAADDTGYYECPHDCVHDPSRRVFLKTGSCAIVLLGLGLNRCASSTNQVPILWIETGTCTGCAMSLLSSQEPPYTEFLNSANLEFQETLMDRSGAEAMKHLDEVTAANSGRYILVVDGAIPTGNFASMTRLGDAGDGSEVTAEELVKKLVPGAAFIIAMGTCASFGGIPSCGPGKDMYGPITAISGTERLVRIPGCPPNPAWISGALTSIISDSELDLDELQRPKKYFAQTVHELCPRKSSYKAGEFAAAPGDSGRCLFSVGCKGINAHADCPSRLWDGRATCISTGHPCMACVSPGFPDARSDAGAEGEKPSSPFYSMMTL